jgi:hypothetical protein
MKSKKKVHKISRMFSSFFGGYVVGRPLCKVDNKTFVYNASTKWDNVDCENCLAKKGTK